LPEDYTQVDLFVALSDIYFIALLMIALSLIGTAIYILQEMIFDRQS
jgi:hypothetical protein